MLFLDLLLVILTSLSIAYSMLLNRRIIKLQNYRTEMQKLFKDFEKAVIKSDSVLTETKAILPKVEVSLASIETKSTSKIEELDFLINKADNLAEELSTIIISGNRLKGKHAIVETSSVEKKLDTRCENEVAKEVIDNTKGQIQ